MAVVADHSSQFTIEKRLVDDVLVVCLIGRVTELFDGKALGTELSGNVLFDLGRLERITSFGVREWVYMLSNAGSRLGGLYLARCSPAFVTQLNMVRNFAGGGRIISFFAPYVCEVCGTEFDVLFDTERDAQVLKAVAGPPPGQCPQCEGAGRLDDDAASYFSFLNQQAQGPIPEAIRSALDAPGRPVGVGTERVEKRIEGSVTRLKVNCALDAPLRWDRITSGLEGHLIVDLQSSPAGEVAGAINFDRILRALPPEVLRIDVEGCPQTLLERIAETPPPRPPGAAPRAP